MATFTCSQLTQTPLRKDIKAPRGHIIANMKWQGSPLQASLESCTSVIFAENLGIVDFHIGHHIAVLYVGEADLIMGNTYKRRLVQFRKANENHLTGIVIVETSGCARPFYPSVQKFVAMELKLIIIPVKSQKEASEFLSHMVQKQADDTSKNPFMIGYCAPPLQTTMWRTLAKLPSVGEVKIHALSNSFTDLNSLATASEAELTAIVGPTCAKNIYKFFHDPILQSY